VSATVPSRQARALDLVGLAGLVVATIVGCGVVLITGHDDGKPHEASATRIETDAGIGFQLPLGLPAAAAPSALEALGVTAVRSYSPEADPRQGVVVVGYSPGAGPTLLGRAAPLGGGSAPQLEEVGDYVAVQVTGMVKEAGASRQVRIYSVPTDSEQAVVACVAAVGGTVEQMGWCTHLATTLVIRSTFGKPLSLKDLAAGTSWLRAEIAAYKDKARSLREKLGAARYSDEQEQAAASLQTLAGRVALALVRRSNDPILLPARQALRRSLVRLAAGYALMVHAADRREHPVWAAGCRRVRAADAELAVSLGQVRIQ
jgi:hypothetical protein